MQPYKVGTISLTQNSVNIVGSGTQFLTNVCPGDLLTIDYQHWYPVAQVVDNLNLILDIAYPDTTATSQSYSVSRISANWGMNATIESQLVALIDDFQSRLDDNWKGIKGDKGDVALNLRGIYASTITYHPGDIVVSGTKLYMCVLLAIGQAPTAINSAYWKELTINTYTTAEGDPI